ncbi:MAG TPA: hypothetical protein VF806_05090, partial [Anaerolineaceae bacterium]
MTNRLDYQLFYERNLPHYQPPGATIFVTYRLANSIPQQVRVQLNTLRLQHQHQSAKIADSLEQQGFLDSADKLLFQAWDRALHANTTGPFWLQVERVARIVQESLFWGDH